MMSGLMWTEAPEVYRQRRKDGYEEVRDHGQWTIDSWEHDGHGCTVLYKSHEREPWVLIRTDLVEYYGIAYPFHTREQMEQRIEREGWGHKPAPAFEQTRLEV